MTLIIYKWHFDNVTKRKVISNTGKSALRVIESMQANKRRDGYADGISWQLQAQKI